MQCHGCATAARLQTTTNLTTHFPHNRVCGLPPTERRRTKRQKKYKTLVVLCIFATCLYLLLYCCVVAVFICTLDLHILYFLLCCLGLGSSVSLCFEGKQGRRLNKKGDMGGTCVCIAWKCSVLQITAQQRPLLTGHS